MKIGMDHLRAVCEAAAVGWDLAVEIRGKKHRVDPIMPEMLHGLIEAGAAARARELRAGLKMRQAAYRLFSHPAPDVAALGPVELGRAVGEIMTCWRSRLDAVQREVVSKKLAPLAALLAR